MKGWPTLPNSHPGTRSGLLIISVNKVSLKHNQGFPGGSVAKNLRADEGNTGDTGLIPGSGRFPGGGHDYPTPVFWSGKSHGQRSLVGYRPGGRKESDMTEYSLPHKTNSSSSTLHNAHGCFHSMMAEVNSCDRNLRLTKLNICRISSLLAKTTTVVLKLEQAF